VPLQARIIINNSCDMSPRVLLPCKYHNKKITLKMKIECVQRFLSIDALHNNHSAIAFSFLKNDKKFGIIGSNADTDNPSLQLT
jgi:hypothetical protein